CICFFFSSRRRHTRFSRDWSSDVCSSDLLLVEVRKQLKQHKNALALAFTLSDIQQQLQQLFYPGLVYNTPREWLEQYPRYLRAILTRLEKAMLNPQKDRLAIGEVQAAWQIGRATCREGW